MSILNALVQPDAVTMCVDTEGMEPDGSTFEACKIFAVPHLSALAGFRGLMLLLMAFTPAIWAYRHSFDQLIEEIPGLLADLMDVVRPHHDGPDETFSFELVVAGYSEKAGRMVCRLIQRRPESKSITVHEIKSSYWSPFWQEDGFPPGIDHDRDGLMRMAQHQCQKAREVGPAGFSGGGAVLHSRTSTGSNSD